MIIVKAVQTCWACPSQWDAWTDTGQYLYLRYRYGHGTVTAFEGPNWEEWTRRDAPLAEFSTCNPWDGIISLQAFAEKAGLTLSDDLEES
jgi:hypothetical protein